MLLGQSPRMKSTLQYDAVRPSFLVLLEDVRRLIIVSKDIISPQDLWAGFTGYGGGTMEDWWGIETGLQLSIQPLPSWKSYYKPNLIHLPGASWQERYHDYIIEAK